MKNSVFWKFWPIYQLCGKAFRKLHLNFAQMTGNRFFKVLGWKKKQLRKWFRSNSSRSLSYGKKVYKIYPFWIVYNSRNCRLLKTLHWACYRTFASENEKKNFRNDVQNFCRAPFSSCVGKKAIKKKKQIKKYFLKWI